MIKKEITEIFKKDFSELPKKPTYYEFFLFDKETVEKLFKYTDSYTINDNNLEFRFELEDRIWIPYLRISGLGFKPSLEEIEAKFKNFNNG